jgi:hypothetical protein
MKTLGFFLKNMRYIQMPFAPPLDTPLCQITSTSPLNKIATRMYSHFEKVKDMSFDPSHHNLPAFLMERFSNFCNSYTKSYNKFYDRKGALFLEKFGGINSFKLFLAKMAEALLEYEF